MKPTVWRGLGVLPTCRVPRGRALSVPRNTHHSYFTSCVKRSRSQGQTSVFCDVTTLSGVPFLFAFGSQAGADPVCSAHTD